MNILGESSSCLLALLFVDCSNWLPRGLVMVMVHEFYWLVMPALKQIVLDN